MAGCVFAQICKFRRRRYIRARRWRDALAAVRANRLRAGSALSGGGAITIVVALALLRGSVLFQSPLFSCAIRGLVSFSPALAPFGAVLVLRSPSGRFTISIGLGLGPADRSAAR